MRSVHVYMASAFMVSSLLAVVGVSHSSSLFATRADAVRFLLTKSEIVVPDLTAKNTLFPDVPRSAWYAKYMVAGVREGIIHPQAKTQQLFPMRSVTRGELLSMIASLYELPENLPHYFKDIPEKASYAPYVGAANELSLFLSVDATHFKPDAFVTKKEMEMAFTMLLGLPPPSSMGYSASSLVPLENPTEAQADEGLSFSEENSAYSVSAPSVTIAEEDASVPSEESPSPPVSSHSVISEVANLDPAVEKTELFALINVERSKVDLPPLKRNTFLDRAAEKYAKDMMKREYFDHFSPEGLSYVDRIREIGYFDSLKDSCSCKTSNAAKNSGDCNCIPHFTAGENLARGQRSAAVVVAEWMSSPPHRKAILQSFYRDIGIGIAGDIWVVNFGSVTFW